MKTTEQMIHLILKVKYKKTCDRARPTFPVCLICRKNIQLEVVSQHNEIIDIVSQDRNPYIGNLMYHQSFWLTVIRSGQLTDQPSIIHH